MWRNLKQHCLKVMKFVTFWPPTLGSKTIVAEDRNPITKKAKLELELVQEQAVPTGCSWTVLPGGVRESKGTCHGQSSLGLENLI